MAEKLLSAWSAYREQAHIVGDAIIKWARPEGWPAGPTSVMTFDFSKLNCLDC